MVKFTKQEKNYIANIIMNTPICDEEDKNEVNLYNNIQEKIKFWL